MPNDAPATQDASAIQEWFSSLPQDLQADPTIQQHSKNDLPTFAKSFVENKKMVGNSIRIPGKDAKPEDWGKVYDQLGYPSKPEEYEIPDPDSSMIPEGYEFKKDDALMKSFTAFAASKRLPKDVTKELVNLFYGIQFNQVKSAMEADTVAAAETKKTLQSTWKTNEEYEAGLETASKMVSSFAPKEGANGVFEAIKALSPQHRASLVLTLHKMANSMNEGAFMNSEQQTGTIESEMANLEKEENEIIADDHYSKYSYGSKEYDENKHADLQTRLRAVQRKKMELMMKK